MKKIFTFIVALMAVLTVSAQGQKTNVWSGTQAMDGMFPFTVDASAFAGVTADQKLSITVADVAAGAYVQALAGDYATELIPYTEIAAAGDVVFELTASAANALKSTGLVLMGGVYTITSVDLVAGQVGPDPTPTTVEAYLPTDETGVAKAEWVAEANEAGNIVDIDATANVHLYALSGPETGWTDGTTLPLEAQYNNGWAVKNNRNNVWDDALGATKTLYFVNGGGNPTTGVAFAAKYKDDVATGDYRRSYRTADDPNGPWFDETGKEFTGEYDFYYSPDGSKGLPKYGAYYKVTAKTDGEMKFLVWNNKGNRKAYVVDGETAVALDPLKGEVKYSGYVNGKDEFIDPADESLGKKMTYFELAATEDNPYCLQAEVNQGQAAWVYLTFNMTAGKEYWLFNENTQLGFGGFEFTPAVVEAEEYLPTDDTGVAKAEWVAEANEAGNVVDIDATANVHLYALSGPETGWTDGTTLPLEAQYNNGWAVKNNRNNVWDDALGATKTLYFVNGGGNPTTGVAFAAKYKDDVATGDYRRSYRTADDPNGPWFDETGAEFTGEYDFYYTPDGSKGLPKYGAYYKVTAKTDGEMKFLVWNNKGNRKAYVVDGETAVALDPLKGEVKYSGYVNGKDEFIDPADESLGKKMTYFELAATEDNPYCLQAEVNQGQAAWVYLTFNMTAGKEYWLFNENTQLGFGGFKFTPGSVPTPPTPAGLKGDADEDEEVTVSDITTIAAYILGNNPSPFNFDNADVDNDGEITVSDITGTAGIILGK